jgi:hypothetical protein
LWELYVGYDQPELNKEAKIQEELGNENEGFVGKDSSVRGFDGRDRFFTLVIEFRERKQLYQDPHQNTGCERNFAGARPNRLRSLWKAPSGV